MGYTGHKIVSSSGGSSGSSDASFIVQDTGFVTCVSGTPINLDFDIGEHLKDTKQTFAVVVTTIDTTSSAAPSYEIATEEGGDYYMTNNMATSNSLTQITKDGEIHRTRVYGAGNSEYENHILFHSRYVRIRYYQATGSTFQVRIKVLYWN